MAVGIAVCTTIGVDHLDVHGSEAGYRAVKRSLFEGLGPDGVAVFHGDDAAVVEVAAGTGAIDIPVGRSPGSVVRITDDALHFGPEFARLTGRPQAIVPITNPLLRDVVFIVGFAQAMIIALPVLAGVLSLLVAGLVVIALIAFFVVIGLRLRR